MNVLPMAQYLTDLCGEVQTTSIKIQSTLIDVLRTDRMDTVIHGNKAFKLLNHLMSYVQVIDSAQDTERDAENPSCSHTTTSFLSFGGRYSNHLHALAALGHKFEIPTIGLVAGYPEQTLTPTLKDCAEWGMQLKFVNRKTYALRYDADWQQSLAEQYNAYVIPEGGAIKDYTDNGDQLGFQLLGDYLLEYDFVWLAVGSGTTMLGLMHYFLDLSTHRKPVVIGINCISDQGYFQSKVQKFNQTHQTSHLLLDHYHGGGFGRMTEGYYDRHHYYQQQGLAIEKIYLDKLLIALNNEFKHNPDMKNARHIIVHGGGLQGNRECSHFE